MNLPLFPSFDYDADKSNAGPRWEKWVGRLENLLVGMSIGNEARKRALLLHYAGERVYDIYDAEKADGDTSYDETKGVLTNYFAPKKNVQMEIYKFRLCKQTQTQTLDEYVTELRTLAKTCEFANGDTEILQQVIQYCKSNRLRRRALRESNKSLSDILTIGRSLELSDEQAQTMEKDREMVNAVNKGNGSQRRSSGREKHKEKSNHSWHTTKNPNHSWHTTRNPNQKQKCRNCGGEFPHSNGCPAKGKTCNFCKKPNHFMKVCRQKVRGARENVREIQEGAVGGQSESDEEYCYGIIGSVGKNSPRTHVMIGKQKVSMIVDTGASVNILDEQTHKQIGSIKLSKRNMPTLLPYGGGKPLNVKGKCDLMIEKGNKIQLHTFYIVKGNYGALLGYETARELDIIHVVKQVKEIKDKYPGLFTGIGKLKSHTVKLHINNSIKPVAQRQRRTPFHLRDKVEKEIEKLVKQDIIEKVEGEPTPWISPIVTPPKKNTNEIRLCIDMREANKAIERERHLLPTIDELVNDLNGSTVFSKLDLRAGYHQVELDLSSRYITAFNTHVGVFRYKRLSFGICSASEIFQQTIRNVIQGINGAKNISDDIIIFGKSQMDYDAALEQVFQRLHENGLTLNQEKCEYKKKTITFFGVVFSGDGISADPKKVQAIKQMTSPQTVSELKSFLGMTSYCSRFIRNYADITEPLRRLTKNDTEWQWNQEQQQAFKILQMELSSDTVMCYYNPSKETQIMTDASPVGLSAIMTQNNRIVAYASRALTDTETRYSQTEREALAVVWACEHFDIYLRGAPQFTILTDHKPLEKIWQKLKPPLRIERWGLRLQPFKLSIKYRIGIDNPSDYISRHPISSENAEQKSNVAEKYVNFIAETSSLKAMTLDEVKMDTVQDKTLMQAIEYTKSGKWYNMKTIEDPEISIEELTALRSMKDELTVHSETILLRDSRIVIPKALRERAIHIAHEGHQGATRTKAFLRSKAWFPHMSDMVEEVIKGCIACLATTKERNRMEPLKMSELPAGPWQNVSADFCGPLPSGEYLFVITDEYSRYPIVEVIKSVSANRVIPILDKTLSAFGIVKTIKTDNGSPFNSDSFRQFASYSGFTHRRITPRWPRANAQAEAFNKPLMKVVKAAHVENKNWKQEMYKFLRQYRATPHTVTGFTPYRLMFQREPITKLPQVYVNETEQRIDELARQRDEKSKSACKEYSDKKNNAKHYPIKVGDEVLVENEKQTKVNSKYVPSPYLVKSKKGNMITAENEKHEITRNSSKFKKIKSGLKYCIDNNSEENIENEEIIDNEKFIENTFEDPVEHPVDTPKVPVVPDPVAVPNRPIRIRREPEYLKDYEKK